MVLKNKLSRNGRRGAVATLAAFGLLSFSALSFAKDSVAQTNAPASPATAPKAGAAKKPASTKPRTPRVRGTASARVIHAVPGGPAVDVYLDNQKILSGAVYKSVSDYITTNSGKHRLKITAAGKTDELLSGDVTLTKNKFYTLAAFGTPDKVQFLRVNETTGKAFEGKGRVFMTHLAQGTAVDVTTPSTRSKTRNYATFLKALEPGKTRTKTVPAGSLKLQVRSSEAVLKEVSTPVEAGKRYVAFVVGDSASPDVIIKPAAPGYVEPVVPTQKATTTAATGTSTAQATTTSSSAS